MKKKVILVDDDRLVLSSMSTGLKLLGYDVVSALSGKEAMRLAGSMQLDIAILDIRMPEITGIELARCLIQRYKLPVVFLSAYSDEETVAEAISCGCMNYLVKPCSLEQLSLTIESVCKKSEEFKQLKDHKEHLDKALSQSQNVCVATGLLMKEHNLSQRQAFERLRRDARSSRKKMADFACDIIFRAENGPS